MGFAFYLLSALGAVYAGSVLLDLGLLLTPLGLFGAAVLLGFMAVDEAEREQDRQRQQAEALVIEFVDECYGGDSRK